MEAMREMADNSVDAVVTDPPYGLKFMGKKWDYDVPTTEVWAECLRVLKPGGHLLSFAGTRTQHRMAVRIEDAGFEIRDMIAWVYGSGFPKSLDVGKAIDKAGGDALAWRAFSKAYASAVDASPMKHSDVDRALGVKSSSCYWARTDHRGGMPPRRHWERVRGLLELPDEFALLYDEAEREVVGRDTKARSTSGNSALPTIGGQTTYRSWDVTVPATESAKRWSGWGTALKPALEPITVARKPLTGTVASNVLEWGTGAINVDGCRVGTEGGGTHCDRRDNSGKCVGHDNAGKSTSGETFHGSDTDGGRWPANLIHDGSGEATEGLGEKARFFYCAKASKSDRDEGVAGVGALRDGGRPSEPRQNYHPTVKPTDLMRYLCRLITPPGGTILDPFAGSGSTGKGAVLEGFNFIGIEREPEYCEIARSRIAEAERRTFQKLI